MFTNYSQTYAAAITTFVGFAVIVLKNFNVDILPADLQLLVGSAVTLFGLIWQLAHRFSKGGVGLGGVRK